MTREKQTTDKKPMSLAEARTRMDEHKPVPRIHGKRQGQAVSSREEEKSGGRRGKR
jgi:hypothetical protein